MKRIAFIINPVAGARKQIPVTQLIHQHIDHSVFNYTIWLTEHQGHAQELAHKAVEQGFDIVVASGGDGTINEVARPLIHSSTALAILPMGSGNGLARHLGIPLNIAKAVQVINKNHTTIIDTGTFNDSLFLSNAGAGFVACVAEAFDKKKTFRGFLGYAWQTVIHFLSYRSFECKIEWDENRLTGKFFAVNICNSNQFGYKARIAPDAKLDDGYFDLVLVKKTNLLYYKWLMYLLFFGNIYRHPAVIHHRVKHVKVQSKNNTHFQVDGEPLGKNSSFRTLLNPLSLRVIIP